jgi:hypothetical protein
MNRESLWQMKSDPNVKAFLFALVLTGLASSFAYAAAPQQQVILPTAQQLVIMSIPDRLALFQSMQSLPPNQRDANLKTLRAEINSLSPDEKEQMRQHFQNEFNALPQDKQAEVMQQLQAVEPR